MQVDFYQLGASAPEQVIVGIAEKVLSGAGRLIIIAEDELLLAKLDRMLWSEAPSSFIPHGLAGGPNDARQPILLSTSSDAPNLARNILIADGIWRDSALSYERSFFLFDSTSLDQARAAWRSLGQREKVERRYWSREDGKWVRKA